MSGSLNLVVLIGRVGRDPESRFTRGGDQVTNLSVATTERWNKDGQKNERTEWHRVEVWGATAKFVQDFVTKGALVSIEGSNRTDEYTTAGGEKRKTFKVKANRVELLSSKAAQAEETSERQALESADRNTDDEQDLPF